MNLVQKAESAKYVARVPMDVSSTLPPCITPLCDSSQNVSTRGWSGAMPKESQLFPNLEDIRVALCQMQCPERDKEIIDDLPLFVPPCVLSTDVFIMQECDNKVVQKSASFIIVLVSA